MVSLSAESHGNYRWGVCGGCEGSGAKAMECEPRGSIEDAFVAVRTLKNKNRFFGFAEKRFVQDDAGEWGFVLSHVPEAGHGAPLPFGWMRWVGWMRFRWMRWARALEAGM